MLLADRCSQEIARREVRCFVTKKAAYETILGIGLNYDKELKAFRSSFDYVSQEAYEALKIRKDASNEKFEFWLPLAIDGDHYADASTVVRERLISFGTVSATNQRRARNDNADRGLAQDPVRHLIAMANALVVNFMKVCDDANEEFTTAKPSSVLRASERALAGYCSIIHLLASYALQNPQVIRTARNVVRSFKMSDSGRSKAAVPDIGQFLVLLCLVDEVSWLDVRGAVVDELFARSVVWMLQPKPKGSGLPGLAYLEQSPINEWRLQETFKASRTGLRLLLFQVFFMEKLAKRKDWTLEKLKVDFDNRRGLPPPGLTSELLERIQFIYKMDNLGTFAKELGSPAGYVSFDLLFSLCSKHSLQQRRHDEIPSWSCTSFREGGLSQFAVQVAS